MTEPPEYPAAETLADKPVVGGAQSAADATFNALGDQQADPAEVEQHLRRELERAGVGDLDEEWVSASAATIAGGEPVVVEPDETTPDS